MRWALAALFLSTSALADPPAELLPKETAPIEWTPQRTALATGVAASAIVTAIVVVISIVVTSNQRTVFQGGCTPGGVCI